MNNTATGMFLSQIPTPFYPFTSKPISPVSAPNPGTYTRCLTERAIPRSQDVKIAYMAKQILEDGVWYAGVCQDSLKAKWVAKKQRFEYVKFKHGIKFIVEICHPSDDVDYDVFYPVKIADVQFQPSEVSREVPVGIEFN